MDDDDKVWPPAPSAPLPTEEDYAPEEVTEDAPLLPPHLVAILVMWAFTIAQAVFQSNAGSGVLATLFGLAGIALALFLVTRKEKAARVNGGLRLCLWVVGVLFALLSKW